MDRENKATSSSFFIIIGIFFNFLIVSLYFLTFFSNSESETKSILLIIAITGKSILYINLNKSSVFFVISSFAEITNNK